MATWQKDYIRYKDFVLNIFKFYNDQPNLKVFLELILSLSTICLFAIFAIRPTILTIIELDKEIKSKEETVKTLHTKIANLQTANNLLKNNAESIALIEQAVPSKATPDILMKQIQFIAQQTGVTVMSFSSADIQLVGVKDGKKSSTDDNMVENADSIPFSVTVTGPYQNLLSFLKTAEGLRRPVKFDSFIFSTSTSEESGRTIVLSITGRVPFVYKEVEKEENEVQ